MPRILMPAMGLVGLGLTACTQHTVNVEPIEVKPIHVTMDINLKVDRRLDDFFAFEDEIDPANTSNAGQDP